MGKDSQEGSNGQVSVVIIHLAGLRAGAGGKTKKPSIAAELLKSRGDRIRTCDPLVPNQVRYRPALLPDHCNVVNKPFTVSGTSKTFQR